jgi:hypothetical protein
MSLDTIEARGFSPRVTAIAARTVATCYQQCFRPNHQPMIGLAIFSVTPEGGGYRFDSEARALRDDELPDVLLDWLAPRVPADGAILSWDHWQSLPNTLSKLATDHPAIAEAAAQTDKRWRDMSRVLTWHLKQGRAPGVPCLCITGDPAPCVQQLPAVFLPDPDVTERTLIEEAMRGWVTWARLFANFDDADHPANRALAAHRAWSAGAGL